MLTPCLGRDHVRQSVTAALDGARWVTLVGPPGSGKSLVARHVCNDAAESVWIDARALRDTDSVLRACLAALDEQLVPGDTRAGALGRAIDGTEIVLVIDGLDVDATDCVPTLQSILEATTGSRFVITALTPAGVSQERVVRVGPLPIPEPRSPLEGPAVDLFLRRVEDAGGVPVDLSRDQHDVHRLLSATGGLPLLIEQAAAQSALLGVANTTASVTLDVALDASYALLDGAQSRLLRALAQFDFPVGLGVLQHVTGMPGAEIASVAAALVRRSLIEVGADGRLDMLSPIRVQVRRNTEPADMLAVRKGVLAWADTQAPAHDNLGAADAPWLTDLSAMRMAIKLACESPDTRNLGYDVANRIYSSLYTSMRAQDTLEVLELVLASGDGPPAIGAQVARRAGIAASEVRGTYAGLSLLDRADEHAQAAARPAEQLAKTASIRAEMHLDAGDLERAAAEAQRAIDLDPDGPITRQATRTLADVHTSAGRFDEARAAVGRAMPVVDSSAERWIDLSARTLMAHMALEQGRTAEAVAAARAVVTEARLLAEDRVGLLAEILLRDVDPSWPATPVAPESLPWAVRIPVMAQDARDLFAAGKFPQAAGLAADVVALADSVQLGRDAVEARLLLGRALLAIGERDQAVTTFLAALEDAIRMPMPLRAADALDGLASAAQERGLREAKLLAATAASVRSARMAAAWGYASRFPVDPGNAPAEWVVDGDLSPDVVRHASAIFAATEAPTPSVLDVLTATERLVAKRVADGLTSRQVAEELFVSPRTVDAHLTHIYRKLDINSRAKLTAIVVGER